MALSRSPTPSSKDRPSGGSTPSTPSTPDARRAGFPRLQRFRAHTHTRPRAFTLNLALSLSLALGCGVQVYNWGGAGSGTQFHVPAEAALNTSPVVQSWIAYSLAKSTCQLQIGGEIPSKNTSFKCELRPREVLVKRWATRERTEDERDDYLDRLVHIQEMGFLEEYVWFYFRERDWPEPDWLELSEFESWRTEHLSWHRPQTRLIGYWLTPSS